MAVYGHSPRWRISPVVYDGVAYHRDYAIEARSPGLSLSGLSPVLLGRLCIIIVRYSLQPIMNTALPVMLFLFANVVAFGYFESSQRNEWLKPLGEKARKRA